MIPTAIMLVISEEPPALINGKVTPVIGIAPVTPPILIKACIANKAAILVANRLPKGSVDLFAIIRIRQIKSMKKSRKIVIPIKPNSSPMTAKIKSE